MGKLAVLFAGQGAQKAGMGKSLYDNMETSRAVFDAAEKVFPGMLELCFNGPQEDLNQTVNTQPCVFTVDMAAYAAFAELGLKPDAGVGFSLGEYAALCAAGVIPFDDALKLVVKRARWMQEAAVRHSGGMAAVLGKSAAEVEQLVAEVKGGGVLQAVNYNCPGQTVVAGDTEELEKLLSYAKENKIKCMKLPVNGAFHSERMAEASAYIAEHIVNMALHAPAFTLYANSTAQPYETDAVKQVLAEQTSKPVRFEQIARTLMEDGFDTFVEVGPGNALTGFMKRMGGDLNLYNISDYEGYVAVKEARRN